MVQEFKLVGFNMEKISSFYGIFRIIWGIFVSLFSDSDSFTSYIPSIIGLCLLFFSLLASYLPQKKRLFMHIVVFIGLLIVLGGLDIIRNVDTLFINFWADISKIMMLISGVFFIFLCIKSFIHARSQ
mgnify:CR=1 FL=1